MNLYNITSLASMPIPKIIYQTWKTKQLPETCAQIQENIQRLNPSYELVIYDDHDMDNFIRSNFDEYVFRCYSALNVGAAKADLWRYCILYKNGGVYLDIDSEILQPLDELIREEDQCIITREGNPGIFNNWIMIFEKEHPILLQTIRYCCHNIVHKTSQDICYLTGPAGPFTSAINDVFLPLYPKKPWRSNLYFESDENLNQILNLKSNTIRGRFYEIDMGKFAKWKHAFTGDLYKGYTYWRDEIQIFI